MLKGFFRSAKAEFLFLQETKMEVIDDVMVRSLCPFRDHSFVFCPSIGRLGGILLVWNSVMANDICSCWCFFNVNSSQGCSLSM